MQYLSNSKPTVPTAIYTFNQYMGKGQIGSKWYSGKHENLTFSLILPLEDFPSQEIFALSMQSCLLLRKFLLTQYGLPCKIKWPNDIYVNNKKLAGTLIQNVIQGELVNYTVLSVGMNVHAATFPPDLPNPSSLFLELGLVFNLEALLRDVIEYIVSGWDHHLRYDTLKYGYLFSLYRMNIATDFISDGLRFQGTISDVDQQGKLGIQRSSDQTSYYNIKEVNLVIDSLDNPRS